MDGEDIATTDINLPDGWIFSNLRGGADFICIFNHTSGDGFKLCYAGKILVAEYKKPPYDVDG